MLKLRNYRKAIQNTRSMLVNSEEKEKVFPGKYSTKPVYQEIPRIITLLLEAIYTWLTCGQ